jgi:hypothetical protein
MPFWDREPFQTLISEEHYGFVDSGPHQAPISTFKLRRNEKLQLRLETVCGEEAVHNHHLLERQNLDDEEQQKAQLKSIGGLVVDLSGVISESIRTEESYRRNESKLRETAHVHSIQSQIAKEGATVTIDWLENLGRYYHWPQIVVNEKKTEFTRSYGRGAEALVLNDTGTGYSSGSAALTLTLDGLTFHLTSNMPKENTGQIKPGYLLYMGLPDELTRRKIRTVLSYALGIYFVHLGHSTYTSTWDIADFRAIAGYSMDMRAFDLHAIPPGWLGTTSHNVLDVPKVSRLVSGLYRHYDQLDFGNLNWGYWHAMCAPLHIKAVHFGAIIEALQRNYLSAHASEFSEKIVQESAKWDDLVEATSTAIDGTELFSEQKQLVKANLGRLNQMPRAAVTDQVFQKLGIVLGDDERQAWKRRHDAAHGNPMISGKEREVIRDAHLLRVLFNRMVLRIVNGNDHYYDYSARPTNGFPIRNLSDPVPPPETKSTRKAT